MKPPSRIIRNRVAYIALSAIMVMMVTVGAAWLADRDIEQSLEGPLAQAIGSYASTLEGGTIDSRAMGAAILYGLESREAKRLAMGRLPPDAPAVLAELDMLRNLYLAEVVLLVDKHGTVIAYSSNDRVHGTGSDLSFRPYVQRALQGTPNVYPAVGIIIPTRGIFLSAPLRAGLNMASPAIGAVVIKVGADKLDQLLGTWTDGIAMLVSPQGIVFASSRKDWLLHSTARLDMDRLGELRRTRQFGSAFEQTSPQLLPFVAGEPEAGIDGARYAVRGLPLEWGDPAGDWTLTFLERRTPWWAKGQVLGLACLAGMITALLLGWYYFISRNSYVLNHMNAKLKRGEELLRESQSIAELGTYKLDIASGVWESSEVLDRLFGIDREFVRDIDGWAGLLHPEERERMIEYLRSDVIGQRKGFNREYRIFTHREHAERWVHGLGRLELDASGNPVEMHGTIQDITERKRAEEEIRKSMRLLEEKELAKTRFLAAAGHDLRQPLAAANLFIDALKLEKSSPEQARIIQRLGQAMNTFNGLLDALLNISRLDAGVIKPECTSIDATELVEWLEQNFAPLAADKQLAFKLHFPSREQLVIHSDSGLIKSVLMNLVSNALKFTHNGGIMVSIRRRGQEALFQVWDTGIGIGDEHQEHIFDEFYQVNNSQRDRASGLGLGLSIAKRALTLLGGTITCRSRPGQGSVFGFSLPIECTGGATIAGTASRKLEHGSYAEEMLVRDKMFVLVEDDGLVAEALINWVEGMGGKAIGFHSAEDALRLAHIGQADYYVVDYMLSGKLNGIQFLNRLHEQLGRPIKAVLMTGDTSPIFIRDAADLRWPVLHKPVRTSSLAAALGGQGVQPRSSAREGKETVP
jgi:PAS domain S-box-containing protein